MADTTMCGMVYTDNIWAPPQGACAWMWAVAHHVISVFYFILFETGNHTVQSYLSVSILVCAAPYLVDLAQHGERGQGR